MLKYKNLIIKKLILIFAKIIFKLFKFFKLKYIKKYIYFIFFYIKI